MTDDLKCPKCGSLALNIGISTRTLMMGIQFTDEEGRYHSHDPNTTTAQYSCRKCGFVFTKSYTYKCWCEK